MNCIETLLDFLLESHLSFQTKLLLLGDFNLVLSPKDRIGTYKPNTPDKLLFSSFLQNHGFSDIFRYTSPNKISYSYFTSKSSSYLDRIYVPLDGLQNLCKIDYIPCPFSDHSQCLIIQIKKLGTINKHTTYWKLNDSILSKQTNLLCVKTYILDLIEKKNPVRDPISWWYFFKRKITKYLKFLSFRGRTKLQNKERILNQKLDLIDKTNTQKYF